MDTLLDKNPKINRELLSQKAEKLGAAIYHVSDHLNDLEPLKWRLRGLSIEIVEQCAPLVNSLDRGNIHVPNLLCIEQIVSVCSLARSINGVSQMNFSIICAEYQDLLSSLMRLYVAPANTSLRAISHEGLHDGISASGDSMLEGANIHRTVPTFPDRTASGQTRTKKSYSEPYISTNSPISSLSKPAITNLNQSVGDRGSKILKIVARIGPASIKQISSAFPECGEKTIQRELVRLVERGFLARTGERRWSRYSSLDTPR